MAHMVSITSKPPTTRTATAIAVISFSNSNTFVALNSATLQKGDALALARVAGIMAAKKTADLIPLAHPGIGITGVVVDVDLVPPTMSSATARSPQQEPSSMTQEGGEFGAVHVSATVSCHGATGVEMEALTAASVAGLTIYDMCKAVDKGMVVEGVRVVEKRGGKSGGWRWDEKSRSIVQMGENEEGPGCG